MRVLFHAPQDWEAEIVYMDGKVHLRLRASRSMLPWTYTLLPDEAMQMAQQLEEAAIACRKSVERSAV